MGIDIKVVAFGFGALALALGAVLLFASFNYTTNPDLASQEMSAGWVFVGIGIVAWAAGFIKSLL